jgi:hypothetical protein
MKFHTWNPWSVYAQMALPLMLLKKFVASWKKPGSYAFPAEAVASVIKLCPFGWTSGRSTSFLQLMS